MNYLKYGPEQIPMPVYIIHGAIHEKHASEITQHCVPRLENGGHFREEKGTFTTDQHLTRNSDVHFFSDEVLERRMFGFAKAASHALGLEYELTCSEDFQFTSYEGKRKQHYGWHIDGERNVSNVRRWTGGAPPKNMAETMDPLLSGTVRKLSASIILNEDFEGGEMRFRWFADEIKESKVLAKKGDAIFFPSALQHMVSPVTKGTRYSIVKWFGGPPVR